MGRLLAFRRDSPPSRSGPKAPKGGGCGRGGRLAAEEGFSWGLASRCSSLRGGGLGERVSRGLVQSGRDAVA